MAVTGEGSLKITESRLCHNGKCNIFCAFRNINMTRYLCDAHKNENANKSTRGKD